MDTSSRNPGFLAQPQLQRLRGRGAGGFFFPWLSRAPPAFPIFPVPALRRRLHSLPRLDFLSTTRRGDGRGSAPQPSPSRSQLPRLPARDRLAQRRRTDAAGRPRATKATSASASSRSIRAGLVGGHRDRAGQGPRGPRGVRGPRRGGQGPERPPRPPHRPPLGRVALLGGKDPSSSLL